MNTNNCVRLQCERKAERISNDIYDENFYDTYKQFTIQRNMTHIISHTLMNTLKYKSDKFTIVNMSRNIKSPQDSEA